MRLEPLRSALGRVLAPALVLLALAFASSGCVRVGLFAPPTTLGGVLQVRTFDAYARGDKVWVKTYVTNVSPQPIMVDRDGWSLKLPGNLVLPRASGTTTQHRPYMLPPGAGHEVFVDFQGPMDLDTLPQVTLVVGGVTVGNEPAPRVIGEIPLSQVAVAAEAPPPPPGAAPPPPPAQ
jgi:hypothetical protein